MKCEDIRELLQSDRLDRELDQSTEREISRHLAQCPECRGLERDLLAQQELLRKAEHFQPPERVWQNIREAIVSEQLSKEEPAGYGIFERLRGLFWSRRPVFALASALTVTIFVLVLAGSFFSGKRPLNKDARNDALAGYSLNYDNGDSVGDMGTSIEEYFL
jgi:predicted anti-sigma-YlaC factor YlaD